MSQLALKQIPHNHKAQPTIISPSGTPLFHLSRLLSVWEHLANAKPLRTIYIRRLFQSFRDKSTFLEIPFTGMKMVIASQWVNAYHILTCRPCEIIPDHLRDAFGTNAPRQYLQTGYASRCHFLIKGPARISR